MSLVYNTNISKTEYLVDLEDNGKAKQTALLSMSSSAPSGTFQKGSKYYNSTDKKIYTAVEDNVWGTTGKDPNFGVIYQCNNDYYVWDGDNLITTDLEGYEKLVNKATNFNTLNNTKYPTTKAVADYVVKQSIIRNFTEAGITKTTSSDTFTGPNGLAEEIRSKGFSTGTTLYGEVRNQGMPEGINNAEIRVEILETKDTGTPKHQVIEFTLFSVDIPPKEWSHIYFDQRTEEQNPWTWIPKAVPTNDYTSDSTNTVPSSKALSDGLASVTGANLFDIKTLSQAIAGEEDKGWACLSHTTRKDIAKVSVPTLYENILTKYNNVEKAELPWTQGVGYNGDIDYHNGYLYYANGEYNQIFRTNDPISTNFTLFAQLNSGTRTNTFRCFTNYMLVVGWNDIRVISYENGSYIAIPYSNSQDADITFKEIGDYIYVIASEHNKIMRIPNVPFSQITTNSLEEIIDCSQFNAGDICDILYSTTDSMWYLITYNRAYFYIHSTNDLFNINNYSLNIFSDHGYGDGLGKFAQTNNRICIFIIDSSRITIFYTDDYFTTVSTTTLSSNLTSGYISYKDGNVYISGTCFYYDPWGNSRRYPELHIINTTTLTGITNSFGYAKNDGYSPGGATRIAFSDNDLFYIGYKDKTTSAVAIHYSGLAPVKHIDSYQISSNPVTTVDITYYKFNDWKICTPDIAVNNDTNLDRVYEYLGYHNYWRINTINETISLPRNSNLWTMMYVGDDYQDSNLPSGSFAGVATKEEVKNLIPSQTDNNGKFLTTNGSTMSWVSIQNDIKSALQIQISFNNEVISGASTTIGSETKTTKSNGLVTFTGLNVGSTTATVGKDGYITQTITKNLTNPLEFEDVSLQQTSIVFTVNDENNQIVDNAIVIVGETSQTTDNNGQTTFTGLLDGTYNVSISKTGLMTYTGTITIARDSQTQTITLEVAPIACYAAENIINNNNVLANIGVGNSEYEYEIVNEDSTNSNILSLSAIAKSSASTGNEVLAKVIEDNITITINSDQDDADIKINNNNEINTVNINVTAISKFLAFKKDNNIIYFKNNVLPFIANKNLTFENKNFIYYIYVDNIMTTHSATTSSVSIGSNIYDGTTLIIDSLDTSITGNWIRSSTDDIELDENNTTIETTGYLTNINPVLPTNEKFLISIGKLNSSQWSTKCIIAGKEINNLVNNQQFWVSSSDLIELYLTKAGSNLYKDSYCKYFYLTNNNRVIKKLKYTITSNVANSVIKFVVNDIDFTTIGSTANLEIYEGDTINWEVAKEGYITQNGSYTVENNTTVSTILQNINLIAE